MCVWWGREVGGKTFWTKITVCTKSLKWWSRLIQGLWCARERDADKGLKQEAGTSIYHAITRILVFILNAMGNYLRVLETRIDLCFIRIILDHCGNRSSWSLKKVLLNQKSVKPLLNCVCVWLLALSYFVLHNIVYWTIFEVPLLDKMTVPRVHFFFLFGASHYLFRKLWNNNNLWLLQVCRMVVGQGILGE